MNAFSRGVKNAFRNSVRTISVVLILGLAIGLALAMLVAKNAVGSETAKIDASIAEQEKNIGTSLTVETGGQFGGGMMGRPGGESSSSDTTLTSDDLATIAKIDHVASANGILTENVVGQGASDSGMPGESSESSTPETSLTAPTITISGDMAKRFANSQNGSSSETPTFRQQISLLGVSGNSADENEEIVANYLNSSSSTTTDLTLSSGEMISENSAENDVVIGDQLAKNNNLSVGSTFELYGKTAKIVGILSSENSSSDSADSEKPGGMPGRNASTGTMIIAKLSDAQTLAGKSGQISQIVATVDNINNVSKTSDAISSAFGSDSSGNSTINVRSQLSNSQTIIDGFNQQKASMNSIQTTALISLIAAGIAAAVIVFLTMLMIVRERRNEIGVLKAIGAKSSTIVKQFVAESLVLTVLASVIGLGIGIAAATPLTNTLVSSAENSSSETSDSTQNQGPQGARDRGNFAKSIGTVATSIDWTIILDAIVFAIIVGGIGAAGASFVATKIRPAEAVRAE